MNKFSIKLFLFLLITSCSIGQSNQEIKKLVKSAKASGFTNEQIINKAKSSGITDEQINAKKSELYSNQKTPSVPKFDQNISVRPNSSNKENQIELKNENQEKDIQDEEVIIEKKAQQGKQSLKYFGYDIFKKDPSVFQDTQVGAVDPSYVISPGDEVIVMLWGETQFRQVLTVNREGFIFIPDIGQVFVNGLNLNLLESKLFKVLSQSFASLSPKSGEATTFLDISLGNLKPLRIQVLGEINQPGAYTVGPTTTLFTSLYYFNGPSKLGSLRDIRLIRNGKEISSIDFYDYLMTGKQPNDEKLQLDDVIFIPKRKKSISISGEINKPAVYELKNNDTFKDLIDMAGGLRVTAYLDRAQIDRVVPMEQRENLGMDRMFVDIDLKEILTTSTDSFELFDGDYISIYSIMDARQNFAEISGAVSRPGKYELIDSMRVKDLVMKADSLLGDAYLDRVDITRIKSNFDLELIKLDLKKILDDNVEENILLQNLDIVKVYRNTEMISQNYVSIEGHVRNPGEYLLKNNMTLYDIIFIAGGHVDDIFIKETYLERAELIRENIITGKKEIIPFNVGEVLNKTGIYSINLKANDRIKIYSKQDIEGPGRFVQIAGSVKNPGRYELLEDNMTIYDLIFMAGGMGDKIFKSQTYLERADLIRLDDDQINSNLITLNLEEVLKDKDSPENIMLRPGDILRVYSKEVFNFNRYLTISGIISNPGKYVYKTNMKIKDLILEAGGVTQDVFRYRVELARIDQNFVTDQKFAKSIIFDIDNNYNLIDQSKEIFLEPYDYIIIRPDPFFDMQKIISVSGAVKYPGDYAILNSEEKISDILLRAGGLSYNHHAKNSQFFREDKLVQIDLEKILKNSRNRQDLRVNSNDKIFVPTKKNIFEVRGEVSSPGFFTYEKGIRYKESIKNCGGFTQFADSKNIYISYPNGKSKKINYFFQNPKIMDGSTVFIGKEEEKGPFDSTEFAKELASILSDFAQVLSFIFIAINQ